jgi:CDGSH-type Zn-finger protein
MPVTIVVRENGPYRIEDASQVIIVDHEGKPIPIPPGKPAIALCRCGASATKPFCDRTHSKIGFKGAEQARKEFDAEQR